MVDSGFAQFLDKPVLKYRARLDRKVRSCPLAEKASKLRQFLPSVMAIASDESMLAVSKSRYITT